MKRTTISGSAVPPFRPPGLRLLRRIARTADAIARRLPVSRRSHGVDLRVWALAEQKILGLRLPPVT